MIAPPMWYDVHPIPLSSENSHDCLIDISGDSMTSADILQNLFLRKTRVDPELVSRLLDCYGNAYTNPFYNH